MEERTYPYKAWTLLPSCKPVETEFASKYQSYSQWDGDVTVKGKLVARADIYPTREAALIAGWGRVAKLEADIRKRQETLAKKKAALRKAEQAA